MLVTSSVTITSLITGQGRKMVMVFIFMGVWGITCQLIFITQDPHSV